MPFGVMKKKDYPRSYRKKKNMSTSAKASKALSLAKKAIRADEIKYAWTGIYTTAVTQALQITHITGVAVGDGASNRDGNKIVLQNIKMMLHLNNTPASNINSGCIVRVLVIQDTQQQPDTPPTVSDILFATTGLNYNAPYNYPDVVHRFRILMDRYINLNPTGAYGLTTPAFNSTAHHAHRVYNIRPKYQNILYNGSASTDIQKNGVYFCICKSSADASNTVTPEMTVQLKYTDA